MLRPQAPASLGFTVVLAAACLAIGAPRADAAVPSCQRGGAKLLAASGDTRVVSIRVRPRGQETRRDYVLACRVPTGRRFGLFLRRDFGLDLIERDRFTIVDDRYVGVVRRFEGGVSESQSAAVWDARARVRLHSASACDDVVSGDFGGVEDAAFLPGGDLAYACGRLRVADRRGDRELEPPGTDVRSLAVSDSPRGLAPRVYWVVVVGGVEQPRSLALV